MSSTKKPANIPGFKIDPDTGKYVPVPVDFSVLFPSNNQLKRQEPVWSNSKRCNDTQLIQPTKFRRTENGVRKELFKQHTKPDKAKEPTKDNRSRGTGVRKSLMKILPSKNDLKVPVIKKPGTKEPSHMVTINEDLEQNAEETMSQGYPFKLPVTPQIKFSTIIKEDNVKTPESLESNDSFMRLEQLCKTPVVTKNESPVSSVCNLLQNNMLLNSEKKHTNNEPISRKEIAEEIRRIIKENSKLHKEVLELQRRQEENSRKIVMLCDKLENCSKEEASKTENEDKENSNAKRRSLRLQNKSSPNNKGRLGAVGSPVILKSGDLRKSTLTKSLVFKCQKYQIESPRIQKAIDMYTSTRSEFSAFSTPKLSRGEIESPKALSWRSNLSLRVQEQCLMLQDTPAHK